MFKEKGSWTVRDLVEHIPPRDIIDTLEKSGIAFALKLLIGVFGRPLPLISFWTDFKLNS